MFGTDVPRKTGTPFGESASAAARVIVRGLRALAIEHARAQRAAAIAERHHGRPAEMRALYLETGRTAALKSIAALETDETVVRARRIAAGLRAAVLVVVLGLIALIASAGSEQLSSLHTRDSVQEAASNAVRTRDFCTVQTFAV